MKVKIIDRILLIVYALLGIATTAGLVYLVWLNETASLEAVGINISIGRGNWVFIAAAAAVALLLLVLSIRVIMLAVRHEPKIDKTSVALQNTEDGSVRISVAAMDTLIKQAVGTNEGVLDVKTKIINHEDSISIKIEMTLTSDVHIPNVTMLLQRSVKNFIEEYSGIAVRDISVFVSSIVEVVPAQLKLEDTSTRIIQTYDEPSDISVDAHEEAPKPVPEAPEAPVEEEASYDFNSDEVTEPLPDSEKKDETQEKTEREDLW